ncbi:hypothetical protein TNCV_1726391 [Trichonephila clavipes]|nr:hypothetical protein TNCV_1726391 [Trichonephila clavipes]
MPLDNKCRITLRAVVISTETESGFIEDDTSPVDKLPEVGKNPVDTAYDVGSVVSVLRRGSSAKVVSLWFLLMALDVWKEVSGVESTSDVVGASGPLLIARSSRSFVFLGRLTLCDGTFF